MDGQVEVIKPPKSSTQSKPKTSSSSSKASSRSENKDQPRTRTKKHPKDHGEVQLTPTSNNKLKITHAPQFLETIRTQYKPEKWPELGIKDLPQSIQPRQPSSTTRVDHSYPGVNLFELTNAISGEFCQQLISTTESDSGGLGYKDIKQEYHETYRHCDRVVCMSESVAEKLWDIIRPQLQKKDVFEVKPYGFGAAGVWKPIGINPCFRFTRYSEGHHFKPHKDGLFVLHDNYRSIYTVMLYLNDSFEGGTTKFYETDPLQKVSGDTEALLQVAPKVNLIPKTGTLVIFNHDALHEGLPITKGKKYVLRTDIIFQRISFALNDTLYFLNDPAFHKAEKHYQKSIVLKAKGKPEQSTKEYLKGLELQAKLCSIPRKELKGKMCPLPATVWKILIDIAGLVPRDVARLCAISQSWFYELTDGAIWKPFFQTEFKDLPEKSIIDKSNVITDPWYWLFKDRASVAIPVVLDVGWFTTKYCVLDSETPKDRMIPSIITRSYCHLWNSTMALHEYVMGWKQTDDYSACLVIPDSLYEQDYTTKGQLWSEGAHMWEYFIFSILQKFVDTPIPPTGADLLVMGNYYLTTTELELIRKQLRNAKFHSVNFLSPARCSMGAFGLETAIVIDIGSVFASMAFVVDNVEVFVYNTRLSIVFSRIAYGVLHGYKCQMPELESWFEYNLIPYGTIEKLWPSGEVPLYFQDQVKDNPEVWADAYSIYDDRRLDEGKGLFQPHHFIDNFQNVWKSVTTIESKNVPDKLFISAEIQKRLKQKILVTGGRSFRYEDQIKKIFPDAGEFIFPEKEQRIDSKLRGTKKLRALGLPLPLQNTRISNYVGFMMFPPSTEEATQSDPIKSWACPESFPDTSHLEEHFGKKKKETCVTC